MQGTTPEDAALQWMIARDDTFHVSLLLKLNSSEANEVQFRIRQRYALLTLWFQQGNSREDWDNTRGWLFDPDECNWFGVYMHNPR
jgi:hypothetical protein